MNSNGKLSLATSHTVLVKFFVRNEKTVPTGIRRVDRAPDHEVDMNHRHDALSVGHASETAAVSRIRKNRVDTGTPVIQNLDGVQAAMIRKGLVLGGGYRLADVHYFEREDRRGNLQYVIVCSYSRTESAMKVDDATTRALRQLASEASWTVNVWENTNGVATVDFVGRQLGQKPKFALVVRKGELIAEPVAANLEEDQE